jgi:hypothetical protein
MLKYSETELAQLLDISVEKFHREVKALIKKDFSAELKDMDVRNPDILLNDDNTMVLVDPRNFKNYFVTELSIFSYI